MLGWINNWFTLYKVVTNKSIYTQNNAHKFVHHVKTMLCEKQPISMKKMLLLPVVELLWSSPGIHFSFTLLLLRSDNTKFSGASGTSENHHNNMALEKKSHRHINLYSRKKKAKRTNFQESQRMWKELHRCIACCYLFKTFKMSTVSQQRAIVWHSPALINLWSAFSRSALASWHIDLWMNAP